MSFIGQYSCSSDRLPGDQKEDEEVIKAQEGLGQSIPGQNKLSGFANDSRSRFHTILLNISRYIPVSIEYAEEVGRNCNIVEFNGQYYGSPALVFAAVLFVIGGLFCFVGMCT